MGAPWLDPWTLAHDLDEASGCPACASGPSFFTPTFQKHAGRLCGGVQVHVTDRRRFPAFLTYLLLIQHARRQDERRFAWRDPPYEYEQVKRPIDILCGTGRVRRRIEAGRLAEAARARIPKDSPRSARGGASYLLY